MKKAKRSNKKYTEAELVEILKDAPTQFNILKHSQILERTEDAIRLVYRCAAGENVRGTGWEKVNTVAKRLGWMQLGSGKGPK
jgi:hypothetical protein